MRGGRIRQQRHIGFLNGGKPTNGRTIKGQAIFGIFFSKFAGRDGKVVLGAGDVRKADIYELYVLILNILDDVLHCLERQDCLLFVGR